MIYCIITSPEKTTVYKNIKSITLPAFRGITQILPNHAEAFMILKKGNIILKQLNKKDNNVQIASGECYVKDNVVKIIL